MTPKEQLEAAEAQIEQAERLLEVVHVAHRLRVSDEYIRRLCRSGKLKGEQHDGRWLVSPAELGRFLDSCRSGDAAIPRVRRHQNRLTAKGRGGVYFVRVGAYIKIGVAGALEQRLTNLRVDNPHAVELLLFIETDTPYELEADLHSRFSGMRHRGEWFHDCPEMALPRKSKGTAVSWAARAFIGQTGIGRQ